MPEWSKSYEDFTGATVRLLVDRNVGHVSGADWVKTGEVPAGSVGEVVHGSNAGFRGMEWSVRFGDVTVYNIPGSYLVRV